MKKTIAILILLMLSGIYSNAQVERNVVEWIKNKTPFELKVFSDYDKNIAEENTEIIICRNNREIYSGSISIYHGYFEHIFKDMNSDGHDDILIYQGSGARANETYNLFLYQPSTNDYKKVVGFNNSPNFIKTSVKGILASMILTAHIDYEFFYLKDNAELIDLKIMVTDEDLDGIEYNKAVKQAQVYVAQQSI